MECALMTLNNQLIPFMFETAIFERDRPLTRLMPGAVEFSYQDSVGNCALILAQLAALSLHAKSNT